MSTKNGVASVPDRLLGASQVVGIFPPFMPEYCKAHTSGVDKNKVALDICNIPSPVTHLK